MSEASEQGGAPHDCDGWDSCPNPAHRAPSLSEFLLARIAEDEENARDRGADAMMGARWKHYPEDAYVEVQSLTLANARRVLAECEAKQLIVEQWMDHGWTGPGWDYMSKRMMSLLALPYADHPDYREEWKP